MGKSGRNLSNTKHMCSKKTLPTFSLDFFYFIFWTFYIFEFYERLYACKYLLMPGYMPERHSFQLDCEASCHNLFKSHSSTLPGTNQYWCHMKNHGRDPCEVRTHDPEVARQTHYPLGYRSPIFCIVSVNLLKHMPLSFS